MKDSGIQRGLVQDFDTSGPLSKFFYGFHKMFVKYLKKFHVAMYSDCCPEESGSDRVPIAFDVSQGQIVKYNPATKGWDAYTAFTTTPTTTSTTTAAPTTTTTTTAAPSTTTTTTVV